MTRSRSAAGPQSAARSWRSVGVLHGPGRRWVVAAALIGLALRVAWVLWVAAEPSNTGSDTGRMLAMARQFADGETYRINGLVSAFHSPGLPFLLTPFAWLGEATGWFSLPTAAGMVNAAAGTMTVVLGAQLADRWFGRAPAVIAAWFLALAPGHIYLTAVPLTETVFTTTVLAALVVAGRFAQRPVAPTVPALLGLGALIGFSTLVRGPGLVLLVVVWVMLRPLSAGARAQLRTAGVVVVGASLVLAPWAVRNGVQVGVWTPGATNNAAFLCHGHGDHAVADMEDLTEELFAICFRGTPYDPDNPDEAAWYPATTRDAITWAVTHPVEEVDLTFDKTIELFAGDRQSLSDARDFGNREIAGATTTRRLEDLAQLWHWSVLALAAVGVIGLSAVRRAKSLWLTAGALVVTIWMGAALDRYHHTIMALLALAAAASVSRFAPSVGGIVDRSRPWMRSTLQAARSLVAMIRTAPDQQATPADRLSLASVASRLALLTFGLVVALPAFDLASRLADESLVHARGAWLINLGAIAAGALSAAAVAVRARAEGTGTTSTVWASVTLVALLGSMAIRGPSDFAPIDTARWPASLLALIALAASLAVIATASGSAAMSRPDADTAAGAPPRWLWTLSHPRGQSVHPVVASVAVSSWLASIAFDVLSHLSDSEYVYARGAYLLTGMGVAAAVIATLAGLIDLMGIDRDDPRFNTGLRHLVAMDVTLVLFTVSFLVRRSSDFAFHESSAVGASVLSLLGLATMAVGLRYAIRLVDHLSRPAPAD